jgi:phospholipid-binding lipoprotein MlaA
LDGISLDKYTFVRDAHLQRRRNQVYDGNPPDDSATEPQSAETSANAPPAPVEAPSSAPRAK